MSEPRQNDRACLLFVLCLSLTGALPGCNDDDGNTRVTASDCPTLAEAFCDGIIRCANLFVTIAYGDRATCVARLRLNCEADLASPHHDTTKAELSSCVSAIKSASCADLIGNNVPACRLTGTLVNGAACGSNGECQSGLCKRTGACGTCAPLGAVGDSCTKNEECASGLVCPETAQPRRCVMPATPLGTCSAERPCPFGQYCAAGTCAMTRVQGASCVPDDDSCDRSQGLYCHPIMRTCQPVGTASPGEPCGVVNDGYTLCKAGGSCENALRGVCLAPVSDGAACGAAANNRPCLAPATCNDGLCRLPNPGVCN